MTQPVTREHLLRALACAIDTDEPPGLAATQLARAVVALVTDRDAKEAVLLAAALNVLAKRFPR